MSSLYSNIRLLKGVSFDKTYSHVLSFSDIATQYNYFINIPALSFTDRSFIVKENEIRLEINLDKLDGYSYAMYCNNNKWYYCFIDNKRYISEDLTAITLDIDVWQTYQFDFTLQSSFVEREHVNDDTIGVNTIDEGLAFGEYLYDTIAVETGLKNQRYLVGCYYDMENKPYAPREIRGTAIPCGAFCSSSLSQLNDQIQAMITNNKDSICCVSKVPEVSLGNYEEGGAVYNSTDPYTKFIDVNISMNLDGYVPRNNKLLTYPYISCYVDNGQGGSNDYIIEHFQDNITFLLKVNGGFTPTALLRPSLYKKSNMGDIFSLAIQYNNLIPYSASSFGAWLSGKSTSLAISSLATAVMPGVGQVVAGGTLVNSLIEGYEHLKNPVQSTGAISSNINMDINNCDFHFYKKTITRNYAMVIDDYFTRYGYRVNALKVPSINSRSNFNYVKCKDVNIKSDIDGKYHTIIENIFNNGVTIWHNANNFRNYSIDNEVL